jgi:hypothetical protein
VCVCVQHSSLHKGKNHVNMKALQFIVFSHVKFLVYAITLCLQSEKQFPDYGIETQLSFHAILNTFIL